MSLTEVAEREDEELSEPEGPRDSAPKPRRRARKVRGTAKKRAPRAPRVAGAPTKASLKKQIELMYGLGGDGLAMIPGKPIDDAGGATPGQIIGGTLKERASPCAQAWVEYLDTNPGLRERFEQAMMVGGLAGVVAAHLPILAACAFVVQHITPNAERQPEG